MCEEQLSDLIEEQVEEISIIDDEDINWLENISNIFLNNTENKDNG